MTASITHLGELTYRLTERIAADEIQGVYDRTLRRQSNAGESIDQARERVGREAWIAALDTARDAAYENALKNSGLRPIGEARFDWPQCAPGADCVFTATFEVLPAVDLDGLEKVEIHRPSVTIGDDDVTRALELLRSEHKRFAEVTRPGRVGDRVTFDFDGSLDGESFEGSSGQKATAVIGAGDVLDDIESALTGRAAGELFEALVTFPGDYARSTLRGETAEFRVMIHTVATPEFPCLDAAFARRLGVASGSLDELRAQLRQRLESECEKARARYERRNLTNALLAAVPVAVPETLLAHEIARVRETFESQTGADSTNEVAQIPEQPVRATAERRVKLSLILSEFIRQHHIRLDEKRVDKKLDELAAGFALPDAETTKRQYRENNEVMHNVQALVVEEQGFEAVLQNVRKTPVSMTFDALLHALD